jgi:hypothetical protein
LPSRYTKSKDEDAFEALFERHKEMVLSVCKRILHHYPDAEDALQRTFFVLARKAAKIKIGTPIRGWLHRAAVHVADEQLADPRRPGRTLEFSLGEIITIALCAVIGGANDWVAVETFAKAKRAWFQRFLNLEQGIPAHDTFGRVFARLDRNAFQNCFRDWIAGVCERLGIRHVAIDGKRLAGSQDARLGVKAIHLVSAWASEVCLTLGQVAVEEKSNEITAIPKLLEMLEIAGALVTCTFRENLTLMRLYGADA